MVCRPFREIGSIKVLELQESRDACPPQSTDLTPDEYLVREEQSDTKHEYIDGHTYAMAGANDAHVTISGNLFAVLRNHVRGSGCRVYQSDMKARIGRLNRFYYPDVMVTCAPRDRAIPTYK